MSTWEWVYSSNPQRWALTVGEWHAIVRRIDGPHYLWRGSVEHATKPQGHRDGPSYKDAADARAWCLATIAKLRAT